MSKNRYLLGSLPFIAFAGIWVSRSYFKRKQKRGEHFYQIGRTRFDQEKRTLTINKKEILLTSKESRLLLFFARSPGELITRERLQKEIWEDEGVIVGRSLDVFISRLRKKLESDEGLQLINIHNKGYKLKIVKWG
ncbi:phosphate regulon transcriptional regulatory protein PhoB [compost metagenome]